MASRGKLESGDGGGVRPKPPSPKPVVGKTGGRPAPPQPPKTGRGSSSGGDDKVPAMMMMKVPQYKKGGRVRKTGVALVHKGEYVVPAKGKSSRRKKTTAKR